MELAGAVTFPFIGRADLIRNERASGRLTLCVLNGVISIGSTADAPILHTLLFPLKNDSVRPLLGALF